MRTYFGKNTCTREQYLQSVLAILNGDEADVDTDVLVGAVEYELETIALRRESAAAKRGSTGEKKDIMESNYAKGLKAAVIPYLSGNPTSAKELETTMAQNGVIWAETGKAFPCQWIARVCNAMCERGELVAEDKVVTSETLDKKSGKKVTTQKVAKAYRLA